MSEMKKNVGYAAVDSYVRSGMKIGMGTGSTAMFAVERLAQKIQDGTLSDLTVVATSFQTEIALQEAGIPVYTLNSPEVKGALDLAIDGADEIDPDLNLIKGGGAAQLMEKIVETAAKEFVVIADESKVVKHMGTGFPLPLEIIPAARRLVVNKVKELGGQVTFREGTGKMGPVISDSGNLIADVLWEEPVDPVQMDQALNAIPGLVEHGFFCGMAKVALVGKPEGSVEILKGKE